MKIDPKILSTAARLYGLELSGLRPLGGMEGMALEFKRGDGMYVLKITPKSKNNPAEVNILEEKLEFINYLAKNKVRVAAPITSPNNHWVEIVAADDLIYLVTAWTKVNGRHIELWDPTHGTPEFFQAWGQVTGQMHRLAKAYPKWKKDSIEGKPSEIYNWQKEHESFRNWCQFDDIRTKWVDIGAEIEKFPQPREGYGLIHNDLHPWNMLVTPQGEINVIDFDVCTYHFFIKDIAIPLFFANWHGNPGKGRSKEAYLTVFFQNFMAGYATENELAAEWFETLQLFLKHHQILLYIVFTDEWKSPNKWQAETLRKWKRQILNDIPVVELQY
jgi:amicoumacin kinase